MIFKNPNCQGELVEPGSGCKPRLRQAQADSIPEYYFFYIVVLTFFYHKHRIRLHQLFQQYCPLQFLGC